MNSLKMLLAELDKNLKIFARHLAKVQLGVLVTAFANILPKILTLKSYIGTPETEGSPRNAPAEFYFNGKQISFDEVLDILDV